MLARASTLFPAPSTSESEGAVQPPERVEYVMTVNDQLRVGASRSRILAVFR